MVHVQYFPANAQECRPEEAERAARSALESRVRYEERNDSPSPGYMGIDADARRQSQTQIDRDAPL
jgi:hypothetical protein